MCVSVKYNKIKIMIFDPMCVLGPRIYLFCLACICWDQCYAVGSKSKITRTRRGASSCIKNNVVGTQNVVLLQIL